MDSGHDRSRLHPLTMRNGRSRIACERKARADKRMPTVRDALSAAFRCQGLLLAINTDHGARQGYWRGRPFTALGMVRSDQGIAKRGSVFCALAVGAIGGHDDDAGAGAHMGRDSGAHAIGEDGGLIG